MKKTVVYISSCGLHENGEPDPFFLQELPWLCRHFDRVVLCAASGVAEISEDRPETVAVSRPASGALRAVLQAPFYSPFREEIHRLRSDGKGSPQNILKLLMFTIRGLKLHHWIRSVLHTDERTTLYAYWMSYDGFAAALCKQKDPSLRAIARAHAFDIDIRRNPLNPYLMKRFMAKTLDGIYPISRYAQNQLLSYADIPPEKLSLVGAGSAGGPMHEGLPAPRFQDGVFRLVSCAAMIDVKQIPLLIDALSDWHDGRLSWTHIGGGPDEPMVRSYAKEKLDRNTWVTYTFTGGLQPEQIRKRYETQAFDAFVNTSKSEGIPVTIMEALQAGIPVIAPKIGGIPELADESVGYLYDPDGGAAAVVAALRSVYSQTAEEAQSMRDAARARWRERCEIDRLLPQLFPDETEGTAKS